MSDPELNRPDGDLWPPVTVIAGWVYVAGQAVQMGFSLSPSWGPPPDFERTATAANRSNIRHMHLPSTLEWWLLEAFRAGWLTSVNIQAATARWRVHLSLQLPEAYLDDLMVHIDSLLAVANLPHGNDGTRVRELNAIHEANPTFNSDDAFFHWLGDRVQKAIQAIFDADRM